MKFLKNFSKRFLKQVKNERGQGMVEYILLLVIVVAIVSLFKNEIQQTVTDKVSELRDSISNVK